ncbi:alpha/beta hydrolase [Nocardioides donggukensis]|uniref:Alpha/beta hydrolase n=1 Tax=Nocardioides donggukensis TaxID=2774019 RepID=A0A927K242_9ACTN|nr:alpha/beta hydrolase [Nocardioides donggukensis]MBD8868312.1 alpha/beta hydrolase [Nocardioides donggukensis]
MRPRLAAVQARIQGRTLAGLLSLPDPVLRRLAGPPVVVDGQTLDPGTQLVLRLQRLLREPAAEQHPVAEGREILAAQSLTVGGRHPVGAVLDTVLAGLPTRVYVPRALLASASRPTLLFLHGGGFIYGGGHATHDAPCRFLAERAGVQVVAVDYRLAPEAPFPAAYDDSVAAYRELLSDARSHCVDVDRLAVGGDSAGGNLATGVALAAAREGLPLALQLLVYPMTDCTASSVSRRTFGEGFFLTTAFMDLATESYVPSADLLRDPRLSPLFAEIPDGLAPAHVVTAGFDPLRDEGEAYASRLEEAGVAVDSRREPGLIHGFLNWVGLPGQARDAVGRIADRLGAALH